MSVSKINLQILSQALSDIGINAVISNAELSFEEAGLDSMDIFNLFLELETLTGKKVSDVNLEKFTKLADILDKYDELSE